MRNKHGYIIMANGDHVYCRVVNEHGDILQVRTISGKAPCGIVFYVYKKDFHVEEERGN